MLLPSGLAGMLLAVPPVHAAGPHVDAALHPASAVRPAASGSCYDLNSTVCVEVQAGSVNIVPSSGNRTASLEPNATDTIVLQIHSQWQIVWPGLVNQTGPRSPIALNVSGTLWNGDPYYSAADYSLWHSRQATDPWWQTAPNAATNVTWPFVYQVTFWNRSSAGSPTFFAGMSITWWIYLVTRSTGNIYHGNAMPAFHYTVAGAWPESPYPAAVQYGGQNASTDDLALKQVPLQPNWNDTVHLTLTTTGLDSSTRASIGSATLYVVESRPNGAPYQNGSFVFPVTVSNGAGATSTAVAIPNSYSQITGLTVSYWVVATDTAVNELNQIMTPAVNYTVHGNGSFQSGQFGNDILLTTTPTDVELVGPPTPQVAAGVNVTVVIQSKSVSASILTALLQYTFNYNATGEVAHGQVQFARNNSTTMYAVLPPFPVGVIVNFTVLAWDYTMLLDISRQYSFETPTFSTIVPIIPPSLTFFTVLVYDNSTATWVTGAIVQIQSTSGYVNSISTTQFGIAYPNQTLSRWTPLLVPANQTYNVSVLDRGFIPAGESSSPVVSVDLRATNPMSYTGTLVQSDHYTIVQEGSSLFFYLNTTAAGPLFSPSNPSSISVPAVLGLVAAFVALAIVLPWWIAIQERRKAEEKRVTL
ncbi:MAG: hypothetical protein L3K04_03050 [Thermoplasmata archaeon]|nr:hypothetical protein [Thermoplasmata archaeon]